MPFGPLPRGHGAPLFEAVARARAADFRVDERLAFAPEGHGEHLWLHLEKRLLDTDEVVSLLGRVYAVGPADVGVSGLKDRRALARQWFSVRSPRDAEPLRAALRAWPGAARRASRPKRTPPREWSGRAGGEDGSPGRGDESVPDDSNADSNAERPALRLLEAARHPRKLRRGTHAANGFAITLREIEPRGAAGRTETELDERVARIATVGFPNYLGPQRFGRGGRNLARALAWFARPTRRTSRLQRGLWLSAARSELFNRVCAARVAADSWRELLSGEPAVLDGSRSFFVPGSTSPSGGAVPPDESLAARLARGDVHPSAPWWGRGEPLAEGDCLAFERGALAGTEGLREGLERAGLAQQRRALRVVPGALRIERGAHTLRVLFELPPGAFASTLLAELGDCRPPEASR